VAGPGAREWPGTGGGRRGHDPGDRLHHGIIVSPGGEIRWPPQRPDARSEASSSQALRVRSGSGTDDPLPCRNVRCSCPKLTFKEEITARTQQLTDEQGPGWGKIIADEPVGKDTAELRHWLIAFSRNLGQSRSWSWRPSTARPRR
jgi:hypothetical protein